MKKWMIFGLVAVLGLGFSANVLAISEKQKVAIVENCEVIKDNLKDIQKIDSRTRVFLGQHFETVLSKFITPLNVRLVENNMSSVGLIENQNLFAAAKVEFVNDFIIYQQELEALVAIDCRVEPEKFYERLITVRDRRKVVAADVVKLNKMITKNIQLVRTMREGL